MPGYYFQKLNISCYLYRGISQSNGGATEDTHQTYKSINKVNILKKYDLIEEQQNVYGNRETEQWSVELAIGQELHDDSVRAGGASSV